MEQNKHTNLMSECMLALSEGKMICDVDYPNFRKIKSEIISIDFTNIEWKPIKVKFLESGLMENIEIYEEIETFGWTDYEPPRALVKKQQPVTESWIMLDWISNYRK